MADFLVVAVEQFKKAGLRAGCAFDAAEAQRRRSMLNVRQRDGKIVRPERGSFADGGGLRRLEVREAERRQVSVSAGELGPGVDRFGERGGDEPKALPQQDQLGVADDELALRRFRPRSIPRT